MSARGRSCRPPKHASVRQSGTAHSAPTAVSLPHAATGIVIWKVRASPADRRPGSPSLLQHLVRPSKHGICSLSFSPDGNLLAWTRFDGPSLFLGTLATLGRFLFRGSRSTASCGTRRFIGTPNTSHSSAKEVCPSYGIWPRCKKSTAPVWMTSRGRANGTSRLRCRSECR